MDFCSYRYALLIDFLSSGKDLICWRQVKFFAAEKGAIWGDRKKIKMHRVNFPVQKSNQAANYT